MSLDRGLGAAHPDPDYLDRHGDPPNAVPPCNKLTTADIYGDMVREDGTVIGIATANIMPYADRKAGEQARAASEGGVRAGIKRRSPV